MYLVRLREWFLRYYNQNVIGKSPSPYYKTWPELAAHIDWDELDAEAKQLKYDRLEKEFNDETWLMGTTFTKLIGLLTPLGLILAFGRDSFKGHLVFTALFIASFSIATIWVVWALSTRLKVFKQPADTIGLSALVVDDGTGTPIRDELGASIWWCYTWYYHRLHTRVAIDRFFLLACVATVSMLFVMLLSSFY